MHGALKFGFAKNWARPIFLLFGLSAAVFWGFYGLDYFLFDRLGEGPRGFVGRYLRFDPGSITDAISALAGIVAAVLGIVITVVSIVVQLSAARFSGITRMFLRDRTNIFVTAFYVVICSVGLWLSVALHEDYVPRFALLSMLMLTTLSVILMVPYFGYVFSFLEPMNIIARIRSDALDAAVTGTRERELRRAAEAQGRVLLAMEELTDITSGSISGKDKIIASGAVDALKDLTLAYLQHKAGAQLHWFGVHSHIAHNPDFVAMDPESLGDLERRKTWVEWKVMRQYLGIYNEALATMRDINYLVAIDTRYIGEAAIAARDAELVRLVFRYMNSYLRSTLNARDVRTAYNVLNQYRLLVQAMLVAGDGGGALEGVRHMIYYGHVSYDMKLPFVTETVAYDVSALCQTAHSLKVGEGAAMLEAFLDLDRPLRSQSQETALIGVRKAQVKLAAYYLEHGEEPLARNIARDMASEPPSRLRAIHESLSKVTSKDFWEIIDRGRNFEYMPDLERRHLERFFGWLVPSDSESPDADS